MRFADPALLTLALLSLPVAFLAFRRRTRAIALPATGALAGAPRTWRLRLRPLLPAARVVALVLLVAGLARPQIGEAEALAPAEGIDIALSLDLSSSMATTAFGRAGSRLDAAKTVIREFVETREDDRVGLVIFQRDALAIAPLTLDYEALDGLIADLESGLVPDGTGIGVGIATALTMLEESTASSRIIILLTDGRHNVPSISPEDAAELAEALRIRVYTIGVISPAIGQTTTSAVDEELLAQVAERTGARYFAASNPEDLAEIYDEIASLETSRVGAEVLERRTELGPWLIAAGALLLLVELALGGTLLRRLPE